MKELAPALSLRIPNAATTSCDMASSPSLPGPTGRMFWSEDAGEANASFVKRGCPDRVRARMRVRACLRAAHDAAACCSVVSPSLQAFSVRGSLPQRFRPDS